MSGEPVRDPATRGKWSNVRRDAFPSFVAMLADDTAGGEAAMGVHERNGDDLTFALASPGCCGSNPMARRWTTGSVMFQSQSVGADLDAAFAGFLAGKTVELRLRTTAWKGGSWKEGAACLRVRFVPRFGGC